MSDIVLPTFCSYDLTLFKLPLIVVYKNPSDYPSSYVARLFETDKLTKFVVIDDTIEGIRNKIPPFFSKLERSSSDDLTIVETWL